MTDPIDQLAAEPAPIAPQLAPALERELANLTAVAPRRPLKQLAMLVGISLVYGAGLLVALTVRRDISELPTGFIIGAALAWLLGFVGPAFFALVPQAGAVTPRPAWALASSLVASLVFVLLGLSIHPSGPASVHYDWHDFARGHTCLEIGLATAFVPVVIGAMCLRGALPVGSRSIAAALGAGGGCLGGLVLHLHCHVVDAPHLGLIHGGVVIVAALLAVAIVPRATTLR